MLPLQQKTLEDIQHFSMTNLRQANSELGQWKTLMRMNPGLFLQLVVLLTVIASKALSASFLFLVVSLLTSGNNKLLDKLKRIKIYQEGMAIS